MARSIQGVARNADQLTAAADSTASAITQMAASAEEMAATAESLTAEVDGVATGIEQMSRSAASVAQNAERITEVAAVAVSSATQLDRTIHSVAELAKQADVSDPTQLEQERQQLEALTAEFKQVSVLALPLGKQTLLLDVYRAMQRQAEEVESILYSIDGRDEEEGEMIGLARSHMDRLCRMIDEEHSRAIDLRLEEDRATLVPSLKE